MCVDVLPGVKDASDKKILVDMLLRAVDIPAPATFMLISGDIDFSNALQQLRVRRYNIILAQPQEGSALLVHAARTVWLWTSPSAGGSPLTQSGSSQLVSNETTSPNTQYPYSSRPVPSPVRQPNPNPGPFPVRRPNADPSGSSGNRIPNQAQNNSPTAARQCACNRRPRCGNVFLDLPPENLFLILFFCMLCLILIKVSFLMMIFLSFNDFVYIGFFTLN